MATLNLDLVVHILSEAYNVPASVDQTGGGVATIMAGTPMPDDNGDERYQACAGPGWFLQHPTRTAEGLTGWFAQGRADNTDFYIGPDDDGQAEPIATT